MKRIVTFSLAMTAFLLGLTLADAQSPPVAHVGVLIPQRTRSESQVIKGLQKGLEELRYEEGENILLEIRNAKGDREALKPMAEELASQKVRLIITTGTRATKVAKSLTSEVPIVFIHPADPVALGLVKSMRRPGANVTGVAALSLEMTEKRVEILKEIVPKVREVLIYYDANNPYSQENFALAQKAATKLGIEVAARPIKSADELRGSISGIQRSQDNALFHIPDDLVESQMDFIFRAAREKRLPTMSYEENWVIKGALAAYGPSYFEMGRQAARLVDKILKGEKPQNLSIERANKFDLVISYRAARIIGLSIPRRILKRADMVIR